MQMNVLRALSAIALSLATIFTTTASAQMHRAPDASPDGSVMQIPARSAFPITKKITLGVGRSMMIQFPMELRDVMVADPSKVDAVVQTSDRVFLVARGAGSTNAFFFDAQGNQIMTLEIAIGSDLSSLDTLLKRLLPNSNIRTDLAGTAIVLMGSVRTPADAARAADIATQFAFANKNLTGSNFQYTSQTIGGVTTSSGTFNNSGRDSQSEKKIINLLAIEGEEQVNLRVTVAEVQRSVLKQFGVNFASNFSVGPFNFSPIGANSLPVNSSTLGAMDKAGIVTGGAIADAIKNSLPLPPTCNVVLPQILIDDAKLAFEGRIAPVLFWEKHPSGTLMAGGGSLILLLLLKRLLFPRRPKVVLAEARAPRRGKG